MRTKTDRCWDEFAIRSLQAALMREHQFVTNDLVRISIRERAYSIVVNEAPLPELGTQEIVAFAVLAREAFVHPGARLSAKEVATIVESGVFRLRGLSWVHPTEGGVYKAMQHLREALEWANRNRDLIQTSKQPHGYRLSTPNLNVILAIDGVRFTASAAQMPGRSAAEASKHQPSRK